MILKLKDPFLSCYEYIADKVGKENLYLVGGFIRDALFKKESHDMDFCLPLDGKMIHGLFEDGLYFQKFGTVSFSYRTVHVTLASLRKEGDYVDYRHPSKVEFVKTIQEDYQRRDFTINSLYMNSSFEILDPSSYGLEDISNRCIRIIGEPYERLKEDPLRIIRAYRFALQLGCHFEEKTEKALKDSIPLLSYLNPHKVEEEIKKSSCGEKLRNLLFEERRYIC